MASFTVLERRSGGESDAEFVRDGFSFVAFLVPLVWLLWHRLWLEAALYVAAVMAVAAAALAGAGENVTLLAIFINLLVGLEASVLRLKSLRRAGWIEWGIVEAANLSEAEARYLAEAGYVDAESQAAEVLPARFTTASASGPALGLLAYPGAR